MVCPACSVLSDFTGGCSNLSDSLLQTSVDLPSLQNKLFQHSASCKSTVLIRLLPARSLTIPHTVELRNAPGRKVLSLHLTESMCRRSEGFCSTERVDRSEQGYVRARKLGQPIRTRFSTCSVLSLNHVSSWELCVMMMHSCVLVHLHSDTSVHKIY